VASGASPATSALLRTHGGGGSGPLASRHGSYDVWDGYEPGGGGMLGRYSDAEVWRLDSRLAALDPAWLAGAAVLDIGCNAGYLCIQLAERFPIASALGVDVDAELVLRARRLAAARAAMLTAAAGASAGATPSSSAALGGGPTSSSGDVDMAGPGRGAPSTIPAHLPLSVRQKWGSRLAQATAAAFGEAATAAAPAPPALNPGVSLAAKVAFRREDFVSEAAVGHAPGSYDVITCLNVTKWVHLTAGDKGVCTMFRKAFQLLRPGGRFILQAQPWPSYRSKARASKEAGDVHAGIRLKPDGFRAYLVDKVGFSLVAARQVRKRSGKLRDLLVFVKPAQ
jgi:7SK snRNA methylphosphate capping enzyme